ncbi:aldehyde:ferredoxin oxidoreductase [Desulfosporosinus orientis DSM 765]|uniref:Aldehyde:ferredoxin oxidoreductase n=1 Tax=Desulfosporosinus orientis (strain ATCC 19365 / DSM 765 / NCIMB 8382 / VKM B-1628 / Singapore I) TaxID=768706 RepID=G7WCT0_DESOD|nr:aldehyde:ferredoxin oxidoreductase [Desulfosporosinus orientis DSM 765]
MFIYRINMTDKTFIKEEVSQRYKHLGGRGFTSLLLSDELDPKSSPLGDENKLVIAPGLLTGTIAPSSGRTSIGAKSPLTGTIKESNAGGTAGQYLAGHNIKALIIEHLPKDKEDSSIIIVEKNNLRLEVRNNLRGLGNYDTVANLRSEFGDQCSIISIGPAGEVGSAMATIAFSDPEGRPSRHAGRGGLGAVMGSKGVKAIVISKSNDSVPEPRDKTRFLEIVKKFSLELYQTKKGLRDYGTALLVNAINAVGGLPTRNFSMGYNDQAEEFSGERLNQLCNERKGQTGHACSRGCAVRCSNVFNNGQGDYVTASLEYETIALLGSNCGINNLDEIAQLDRLCDDLGLDTMETGVSLGVAMEGGALQFGHFEQMKEAINDIVTGVKIGRIIGQGAVATGRILKVSRVPAVKGQGLSAYDPRALKGTGVTYATSPMGADHTSGNCLPGRGGLKPYEDNGQVDLSKNLQIITMICDFLGICIFVGPVQENMPVFSALASSFTGEEINEEKLYDLARSILEKEVEFNVLAGIDNEQNDLPRFFREEPLPNNGYFFDIPAEELKNFKY